MLTAGIRKMTPPFGAVIKEEKGQGGEEQKTQRNEEIGFLDVQLRYFLSALYFFLVLFQFPSPLHCFLMRVCLSSKYPAG